MKRKKRILFIFFFIIFSISGDSTIFLKFSQGEPTVSVISETAKFSLGNCRAEITYPRLEPISLSVKKLNLSLKKTFLDPKYLFENMDCSSQFRRSDPAFYAQITYSVSLNTGDYLSILSTYTGFLARAKNTDIKKRGLNFRISNGYPIFLDSILRPESGYNLGLEEILKQKYIEKGHLENEGDMLKYRKKKFEFVLKETEIEFFLNDGRNPIPIGVTYGELEKYLNMDLMSLK